MITDRVVAHESQHTENQTNRCCDRQSPPFGRTSSGIERAVIDVFERCLVEVAVFVRVRIEEETLGATLHGEKDYEITWMLELEGLLENATGFLQD